MRRFLAPIGYLLSHAFCPGFEREQMSRPQLDDQAFYEAHYSGSGIPEDIPIRVRKVLVIQLGDYWMSVRTDDSVCDSDPDVDLAELLYEIEDEFGIKIPDEALESMEGTFDGIVRFVASKRHSSS
jgi:acyl carrier protein